MTNNKLASQLSAGIGNIKHLRSTDRIKILTTEGTAVATTIKTYHDSKDATNYQVPTGYTYQLLSALIKVSGTVGGNFLKIGYSDAVDTNTNLVQLVLIKDHSFIAETLTWVPLNGDEVPAGKYPGHYSTATQSVIISAIIIGIERKPETT